MKTRILLIISSLILTWNFSSGEERVNRDNHSTKQEQVSITYSNELQGLANQWVQAYNQLNAKTHVALNNTCEQGKILNDNELAILDGKVLPSNAGWTMTLGREVIVPVINKNNPFLLRLMSTGVSKERLRIALTDKDKMTWGALSGSDKNESANLIILNDNRVKEAVQKFLDLNSFGESIVFVDGIENFRLALENNPLALGFCNLTGILDADGKNLSEYLRLLPLDKNGNGNLDYIENIYADVETFTRGVWIGKYPPELTNEIYAVAVHQPENRQQADFLGWILTGGQKSLAAYGFNNLVYNEVQSKLDVLAQVNEINPVAPISVSFQKLLIFIAIVIALAVLIIFALSGFRRAGKATLPVLPARRHAAFDEKSLLAPKGLFYDKSHTWAFMEQDGSVKLGIDDFMQHVTGPVSRLEMKHPGEKVKKGEALLTLIQKGKKLVIYAPVSGKILEVNSLLESDPSILCLSPYSSGWLYRLEPAIWLQEIPTLSMAERYMKWISEEITRLKDFLAVSLQSHELDYNAVVLQDGGMLKNDLLEEFGPEVWEDFQTRFLDVR